MSQDLSYFSGPKTSGAYRGETKKSITVSLGDRLQLFKCYMSYVSLSYHDVLIVHVTFAFRAEKVVIKLTHVIGSVAGGLQGVV